MPLTSLRFGSNSSMPWTKDRTTRGLACNGSNFPAPINPRANPFWSLHNRRCWRTRTLIVYVSPKQLALLTLRVPRHLQRNRLLRAIDAAHKCHADLQENRQPASGPTSVGAHQDGQSGPIPRRRARGCADHRRCGTARQTCHSLRMRRRARSELVVCGALATFVFL